MRCSDAVGHVLVKKLERTGEPGETGEGQIFLKYQV